MPNKVYVVRTSLSSELLGEAALATFKLWVEFAIGKKALGGKTLKHATGDYASAIHYKIGERVAEIWTDEDPQQHPSVQPIEYGRPETELKPHMLGKGNTRMDHEGHLYRIIPLKGDEGSTELVPGMESSRMQMMSVHTKELQSSPGHVRFRVMSDKPGSSPWKIPPMKPYAPAEILAGLLKDQFGKK